jgi:DNA repair exonuclease SbcCD ATPase subunit
MPYKDPEKRKEYDKQYREKNKEKIKEYQKEYNQTENRKQYEKEYRENNKDKIKECKKQYYQTEQGKKSKRISNWKISGVIHQNFDELYEKYINTEHCELCSVELTEGKRTNTTRVLDHEHQTGEFRNILCHSCNRKRN